MSITKYRGVGKYSIDETRIVEVGSPENERSKRFLNQILLYR